jgi:transcriptional regulator with XRE-family HTH domain
LTQKQLADQLKTSAASISRLEKGEQPYSQETLEAIADALNCEPRDLISREPGRDTIWSLWEQAKPDDRETITELAQTILKRRASPREEDIKTVRLGVAEHMATVCIALLFLSYGESQIENTIRGIADQFAKDTWAGVDPTHSDMYSAEAEDAVRSLLAAASEYRATLRRPQPRRVWGMPHVPSKKRNRERVS